MKLASLQPSVTVAKGKSMSHGCKGYFCFSTASDGCKEANFMSFSHEYGILDTTSWKVSQEMQILLKNSMTLNFLQPSVMVAKRKISFATMTDGCKAVIIYQIRSLLKFLINQ